MADERRPFIFVVMPFDSSFDDVYQLGIRAACDEVEAACQRVDEQIFQETILERIISQIRSADLIIAEMTGRKANVFYEVGFAHALNKRVILVTRNAEDIPFDLMPFPHVIYDGSIIRLKAELVRRIPEFLAQRDGYSLGQGVITAPRPDVRVRVQNVLAGNDLSIPALVINAQNHSPVDVYLGNFYLKPRRGGIAIVPQDGLTGRFQSRIILRPGEGHSFFILAEALFGEYVPGDYLVAGVRDEVDREYETREEELASALEIVYRDFNRRQRPRA
jgi:hypothetical protein